MKPFASGVRLRAGLVVLLGAVLTPRLAAQQAPVRKELHVLPWGKVLGMAPDGGWRKRAQQVAENRQRMLSRGAIDQLNAPMRSGVSVVGTTTAITGTMNVPVILFRFADHGAGSVFDTAQYNSVLFADVPPNGRPYTVKSYYSEVSNGLITIHGAAYGWFTLPGSEITYTGSPGGCPQNPANASHNCNGIWSSQAFSSMQSGLIAALQQADPTTDFSQYDNDGPDGIPNSGDDDGVVDLVIFMQSEEDGACNENTNNNPWSHESSLSYQTNDARHGGGFITVHSYTMQSAVGGSTACNAGQITPVGTAAHETGHAFGLPDLYDTQSNAEGAGEWAIMGSGNYTQPLSPAHHDVWSKQQLGWVTLTVLSTSGTYNIDPIVTSHTAYYVRPTGTNPRGEYFLLENKQALGSDTANLLTGEGGSGTPGKLGGLLIWHIDSAQVKDNGFASGLNSVNSGPIQGVKLMQADGLGQLQSTNGGNRGDRGDPYPGSTNNTVFGAGTSPAAVKNSDGTYVGFQVDSIKQVVSNGQMSFRITFGGAAIVRALDLNAQISVDGVKYNRFANVLTAGTLHTIAIDSLQSIDGLTQYVFSSWSDGGARSHQFTAHQAGDSISAAVNASYLLKVLPVGTGGLTSSLFTAPALALGQFVRKDSVVTIVATPPLHGVVDSWTGDTVASGDTLTLTMRRPFQINVSFLSPSLDGAVVLQQLTGVAAGLSTSDKRYLDLLGNNNGKFDLGDFLAWVKETGATPSGQRVATRRAVTSSMPRDLSVPKRGDQ